MRRSAERDIERAYPRARFVVKLRRLADAIERGEPFSIQVQGERLRVPHDAEVSVEHERAAGVEELEFQLRWRTPGKPKTATARRVAGTNPRRPVRK